MADIRKRMFRGIELRPEEHIDLEGQYQKNEELEELHRFQALSHAEQKIYLQKRELERKGTLETMRKTLQPNPAYQPHEIIPKMYIIDTFKGAQWERGYFQHWYTVALLKDREGKYWIDPDYPSDNPRDLQSIGVDPKYKEFEDINDSALTPESYTAYVIAGYSPNYHFLEKRAFFSVSYMGRGYFPEDVKETARRISHAHGVRADAVGNSYYFVRAGHFDKLKEELEKAGIEVEELSRKDVGAYWDQEGRAL